MIGDDETEGEVKKREYVDKPRRYLISGTLGTGKSAFCLFLMVLFVKAGNTPFFYNFHGLKGLYNNGHHYLITKEFLDANLMCNYKVYFLYDDYDRAPIQYYCATSIVFSAPCVDRYREYRKGGTVIYYMPLWSEDEVRKLNRYLPTDQEELSDEDLEERFSWTGGVPRNIFLDWEGYEDAVRRSAPNVLPAKLGDLDQEGVFEEGPECIIGARVNVDEEESKRYRRFESCFLSEMGMKLVLDHYASFQGGGLVKFILENADFYARAGLLLSAFQEAIGRIFDSRFLLKLAPLNSLASDINNEGNVPVGRVAFSRDTSPSRAFALKWAFHLPVPERINFEGTDFSVISPSKDVPQLWIPLKGSFPMVDFSYANSLSQLLDFVYSLPLPDSEPLVIGFQITSNWNRGIAHEQLKAIFEKFGKRFILVWAIGSDMYDYFDEQAQKNAQRKIVPNEELVPVPQFKFNLNDKALKEVLAETGNVGDAEGLIRKSKRRRN